MRSMLRRHVWRGLVIGLAAGALCAPAAAFAQVAVGNWQMDEPVGETVMTDSSGNGFNGALHGAVSTGSVDAATGKAYEFNTGTHCSSSGTTGSGFAEVTAGASGISTPDRPTFNPGTQAFTVSVWVKTSVMPGGGKCDFDLIRKGSGWKVEIFPFNKVAQPNCVWKGKLSDGSSPKVALHAPLPNGSIIDGNWHKITCARTAGAETVLVDDVPLASSGTNVGSITNKAPVFVGAQEAGADFYIGLLDDVEFDVG